MEEKKTLLECLERELESSVCEIRKSHDALVTTSAKSNTYYEALAVSEAIFDFIKGMDKTDVAIKFTRNLEDNCNYRNSRTRDLRIAATWELVLRYINSESRLSQAKTYLASKKAGASAEELSELFCQITPLESVAVPTTLGYRVTLSPSVVFQTKGKVEVVRYKNRVCPFTKTEIESLKKGNAYTLSEETKIKLRGLFARLEMAKILAPAGQKTHCVASIYYLKKQYDSKIRNPKEATKVSSILADDFFNGGKDGNIVNIAVDVIKDDDGNIISQSIDFRKQFLDTYKDFEEGKVSCTEDDCKACELYYSCANYTKSPKILETEKVEKPLGSKKITASQLEVIMHDKGAAVVNASAGAGKTMSICANVPTLVSNGEDASKILMITFSESAASEMKVRIAKYAEEMDVDCSDVKICTFNAFGDEQIKEHYEELGFVTPPSLIPDTERFAVIASLLDSNIVTGLDYYNFDFSGWATTGALLTTSKAFEIIKRECLGTGDEDKLKKLLLETINSSSITDNKAYGELLDLYVKFEDYLTANNFIEYADQETMLFQLMSMHPFFLEDLGYEHIIVDEFQDTSPNQAEFVKALWETKCCKSLLCVGDDSQAIYGFRGTKPDYIINFFDYLEIPEEERISINLLENFRCSGNVIDFANKINALNIIKVEKDMIATRPAGEPVTLKGFHNVTDEKNYIITEVEKLIEEGTPYEDIAILMSDRYELMSLGSELTKKNIPWVMLNPELYSENSKCQAAIALAKAYHQADATSEILTYLNALFDGEILKYSDEDIMAKIEIVKNDIADIKSLPDKLALEKFKEQLTDINDGDEVYESFLNQIEYKPTLKKAIQYILDFSVYGINQTFRRQKDYPGIVLTTNFSSKGLEWPVVFCSISKLQPKKSMSFSFVEERRRLLFVSATRAIDKLYVTGKFIVSGSRSDRIYNQFLKECFTILGKTKEYIPEDPNEEMKILEKKKLAAEAAKARREKSKEALERRTKTLEEAMAEAEAAEEAEKTAS